MPAPTSYTEASLKTYMDSVLGDVADVLGWTVAGGSYDEPVSETLLAYGTDDISTITGSANIRKLRTLARREVWRAVVQALTHAYSFETDGQRFDRSQLQKQAIEALRQAESEAMPYDGYAVGVDAVVAIHDPYAYIPDDERTRP